MHCQARGAMRESVAAEGLAAADEEHLLARWTMEVPYCWCCAEEIVRDSFCTLRCHDCDSLCFCFCCGICL